MVRNLRAESERARRGRSASWCAIDVIVMQASDVEVLAYALDQDWIELSPGGNSVRVTVKGKRAIKGK